MRPLAPSRRRNVEHDSCSDVLVALDISCILHKQSRTHRGFGREDERFDCYTASSIAMDNCLCICPWTGSHTTRLMFMLQPSIHMPYADLCNIATCEIKTMIQMSAVRQESESKLRSIWDHPAWSALVCPRHRRTFCVLASTVFSAT